VTCRCRAPECAGPTLPACGRACGAGTVCVYTYGEKILTAGVCSLPDPSLRSAARGRRAHAAASDRDETSHLIHHHQVHCTAHLARRRSVVSFSLSLRPTIQYNSTAWQGPAPYPVPLAPFPSPPVSSPSLPLRPPTHPPISLARAGISRLRSIAPRLSSCAPAGRSGRRGPRCAAAEALPGRIR
jgi:hypothetical protein